MNPALLLPVVHCSSLSCTALGKKECGREELHGGTSLGHREEQEMRNPEHITGTRKGVAGGGLSSRQDKLLGLEKPAAPCRRTAGISKVHRLRPYDVV